jgi:outer membrane protein TolC
MPHPQVQAGPQVVAGFAPMWAAIATPPCFQRLCMPSLRPVCLLLAGLAACHSYRPEPVDLAAHAAAFAAALPDAEALRQRLEAAGFAWPQQVDFTDGIALAEARLLTLVLHPDCRLARLRAGIDAAAATAAGLLADPQIVTAFQRILPQTPTPWLTLTTLGISIPLNGRLAAEKELANGEAAVARWQARLAELRALDQLETAWLHWSADRQRGQLLADLCQRLDELVALAERLAAAGEMTRTDARTFALEQQRRRIELLANAAQVQEGALELHALLGVAPTLALTLEPSLAPAPRQRRAAEELDPTMVPTLAALAADHQRSEAAHALAIRMQWADLQLFPGHAEEDGTARLAFGFTLPIPLWNGNLQEIRRTAAARDAAAEALRCGLEQFRQQLAVAELRERNTAAVRDAVRDSLLPLAAQQVDDVRQLAALGNLDVLRILDAVLRAHEARWQELAAIEAHALAQCTTNTLFWPDLYPTPESR